MKIRSTSIELLDDFFKHLKEIGFALPEFTNSNEIIIFSDYSGERADDRHSSYSFYVIDKESFINASSEILTLRKSEPQWHDNSFIEFKKLNKDKVRRRILPKFLRIFDKFEGLVITVLVDRNSPDYFMKVSDSEAKKIEDLGLGTWKTEVLRKSANILSILAFLTRKFVDEKKSMTWYSDRDAIFGGDQSRTTQTLDMLSQFLYVFDADIKGQRFNYVSDKHTLINSDFLAIPDLSAGAVLDYYQISFQGGKIKDSTKQVIGWMTLNSTKLKKLMIIGKEEANEKHLLTLKNYG